MSNPRKKYEVSDPAFYTPVIARQKAYVRLHPHDTEGWVKLGGLFEARLQMTSDFAKRDFVVRYFLAILAVLTVSAIATIRFLLSDLSAISVQASVAALLLGLTVLGFFVYLWSLRYPASGAKYFKRALSVDPNCADAYMGLGLIWLRRFQKQRAFRFLEKAAQLGGDNRKKIVRELKSIYAEEFFSFFEAQAEKTKSLQQSLDGQQEVIKGLRVEKIQLEKKIDHFSSRVSQAKWETGRTTKLMDREIESKISAIHKAYEEEISDLKREMSLNAEEFKTQNFVRLTTEILELKAGIERQSFQAASMAVEDVMGTPAWKALSDQARLYLATAEQVWSVLVKQEEKPDFSLVGMELCKALETEINRTLVTPFARNLGGEKANFLKINHIGDDHSRPFYFTYLAKVVDEENYPDIVSLTLGQYLFVLDHAQQGDAALNHYREFLNEINRSAGTVIENIFLARLKTVVKRYRNLITHHASMDAQQLHHLRELIFAGDNSLLENCSKIDRK